MHGVLYPCFLNAFTPWCLDTGGNFIRFGLVSPLHGFKVGYFLQQTFKTHLQELVEESNTKITLVLELILIFYLEKNKYNNFTILE
jgi:hypothetical protein